MPAPVPTPRNQSSGILERLAPSGKMVVTAARIDTGPVCVGKRDKRYNGGKPRRPRRLTERRFDPLKLRTPAQWRASFESLGIITVATICCARKVYWDYPETAPITGCFKEAYLNVAYLPNDEDVVLLLLRLGYTHLQACRALAMTGKRSKYHSTDREVNKTRRMGEAAKAGRNLCNDDDGLDGGLYTIRWGSKFDPPPPDNPDDEDEDQNPILPSVAANSSSTMATSSAPPPSEKPAILGLGMSVRAFLALCEASRGVPVAGS